MDINELRQQMEKKTDEELLGILSRRNLYSPVQLDIAIEILKNRKDTPAEPVHTPHIAPSETDNDPTSLFTPGDIKKIIEESEKNEPVQESEPIQDVIPEEKELTEPLPKISEDYISFQKITKETSVQPSKSKAPVIIASVISFFVIVGVVLLFIFRPGLGLFKSNYENENFKTAQFFYIWCNGNSNNSEKIAEYFEEEAIRVTNSYLDGEISFEDANKKLSYIKLFNVELAEDYIDELKQADNAEELFKDGMSLYDTNQYYDAIKTFSSIYKGYKKYDEVEEAIEDCRRLLKNDLEEKMEEWLENHEFEEALEYIQSIKDAFEDDVQISGYETAIADQIAATEERNSSAEEFFDNGGDAEDEFISYSGLSYPSKKITVWEETGTKVVFEYGVIQPNSRLAFAVFADIGNGMEEIYSYKDATYDIYNGTITSSDGQIIIEGQINTNGILGNDDDEYTDVTYVLKYNGTKAYLGDNAE